MSLGDAGAFVFDASRRDLELIGHLHAEGHSVFRLQVDSARGLLLAGGFDAAGGPVIDLWKLAAVNGGSDESRPLATLQGVPWTTADLGLDTTGTGLLHTWDSGRGADAVPYAEPTLSFSGLYLGDEQADGSRHLETRSTARFAPLGVPLTLSRQAQLDGADELRSRYTAAFRVRAALPGSLGDTLTVRLESLRARPDDRLLATADLGPALAPPGGPGWPDAAVTVTLHRLGTGDAGPGGRLSDAWNLYESEETVVLLADPRASEDYTPGWRPGRPRQRGRPVPQLLRDPTS